MRSFRIIHADVIAGLKALPDASLNCCVTSPPYWGLRDYGVAGQIGLERTPEELHGAAGGGVQGSAARAAR
jgi:DNA modification methylase